MFGKTEKKVIEKEDKKGKGKGMGKKWIEWNFNILKYEIFKN